MTDKQANFITYLMEDLAIYEPRFKKLYEMIPRNNEKYPNEKADYRRMILIDRMQGLSQYRINKIISALKSKTAGAKMAIRPLMYKYKII